MTDARTLDTRVWKHHVGTCWCGESHRDTAAAQQADEALNRCCSRHVTNINVMSPTTCTTCGAKLQVRDRKWVEISPATYAALVKHNPEAAGLIASIQEQNRRDIESALPSWEDVDKARQEGFERGYETGRLETEENVSRRIFGRGR